MSDEARSPVPSEPHTPRDGYERIVDQIADLLQTASEWLRQEAEATVKEKIVPPLQMLGLAIASAFTAGALLVIGLIFIAVALFMWLAAVVGYPWAFFIVGSVYLIGSAIFLYVKVRSMQK
jgi:hypothetical protein